MTALAKARPFKERVSPRGRRFPAAAAVVVWQGAMVALTDAGANSVAKPASADATLKIVGVAWAIHFKKPCRGAPARIIFLLPEY